MSLRLRKNNMIEGDNYIEGRAVIESGVATTMVSATSIGITSGITTNGVTVGSGGTTIPRINVVAQAIDLAQVNSAVASVVSVAFTSGAVGTVSSGDYCIPLSDQLAASGIILTPGQTATGDTLTFGYLNVTNIDPAVTSIKFLILHSIGV